MADLHGIVDRLAARLGAAVGVPEPLDGGITNRNYRVQFGAQEYVVRLPGKDTALLGISREAERIANAAAAELGIAPAVAAGDEHCLVTGFLHCRPIDEDALRVSPDGVARALRAFHDSGTELPVRFWVPELLESYAAIVHARGAALPAGYAMAREVAARIAAVMPLAEPVACHNDLLPANLLTVPAAEHGGRTVMLVDWEYAGMGHRFFDLGNLAVNNAFDEPAERRLLEAYFGEPPGEERLAALRLMRAMSDAREAAWGVVQGVISELEFDFGAYADSHFERLAREADDPGFDRALAVARA